MIVSFAFASLILIALPGPDYALITRNALVSGRSAGIRTTLGGTTGLTVHAVAAALGLSALLAASAAAYPTLKLVLPFSRTVMSFSRGLREKRRPSR